VANKIDAADPAAVADLVRAEDAVPVSAATGEGVDKLMDVLAGRLRSGRRIVELRVPYSRGEVLAALHREGDVLVEIHEDDCTRVRARLPDAALSRFLDYRADEESVTGGP
jgi:GTP-binding protein HflX